MSKQPTILKQFRSFYFQNSPKDFEQAIEYFSVFGGMGWSVDTSKPLEELIRNKVFKNYTYIHGDITKITQSDKTTHSLLSGIAMGDRRVHSALKRARINRNDANSVISTLSSKGFITTENSLEAPPELQENIDEKINFSHPFMRFWFSFVSPYFKTIKNGDYKEAEDAFANRKQGFYELTFMKLSMELMKKSFMDDAIVEIGSYWDRNTEIDILAKTASGKIVVGICKYSSSKAKKSELSKLKEQCLLAELNPDIFVIISKNGFSNELKAQKSTELKLLSLKSFKVLVEDLSDKDLIESTGKRY